MHGLLCWHVHTGDEESLRSARRAGDWLVREQDEDGAWRRHYYMDVPTTYSAFLSCWLADLGVQCREARYCESATRHLDWILAEVDTETGWVDKCGFYAEEHTARISNTHTLGYTIAGLLHLGIVLEHEDAIEVATRAARSVAECVKEDGWLPGVLDWRWRGCADYACLTGNSQMALVWMTLFERTGDRYWLAPAKRCLELAKRGQLQSASNPGLDGGFPGSDPLWGWYNDGAIVNWAAKFFVDAILRWERIQ